MGSRTKARRRALDVLFEAEQRDVDPAVLLAERIGDPGTHVSPLPPYAVQMVEGVLDHAGRIDELLTTYSQGWTLARMPAVDRCVLRLGTWEVLWNDDVPDAVAVDEAVAMVRDLSTDTSAPFVNGLLGRIMDLKPTLLG
ncbi:MAG: transcription antitermination factor NusB [Micrococcales bacterium]|nr:transcription antitermination factor NusB [Micrococcales bacterium]MCL2666480.1 transcription antitermination factor NusB [Micrococcales bacterium]